MNKKVTTVITVLLWVLVAISSVLFVMLMMNVDDPMPAKGDSLVNTNIVWAYILLGFGAAAAFLFSLYQVVTSGRDALKSLGALVAFGVVAFIAYSVASPEIPVFHNSDVMVENGSLTAGVAKTTDTLLFLTYMLLAGAVGAIVFTPVVRRLLK